MDRNAVAFLYNDPVGESLDYSNTICDTLFYNGKTILLETSPLLQLKEIKDLLNEQASRPDAIYNCTRGYTALWQFENNKLLLLAIHLHDKTNDIGVRIVNSVSLEGMKKGPLHADWVSGKLSGGSDAVKTNYGYAFKREHEFNLNKGVLTKEICNAFPTGALENDGALNDFLITHSNVLLDAILNIKRLQVFSADTTTRATYFSQTIPLTVETNGEVYYASHQSYQKTSVSNLSRCKSIDIRLLISGMNLANMFPEGSFYPRFLRNRMLYKPVYIHYEWNLAKIIRNACLLNYDLPITEVSPFWKRVDNKNPR
jgi:hypothetical protein